MKAPVDILIRQLAFFQMDGPRSVGGGFGIVRDEDDGLAHGNVKA